MSKKSSTTKTEDPADEKGDVKKEVKKEVKKIEISKKDSKDWQSGLIWSVVVVSVILLITMVFRSCNSSTKHPRNESDQPIAINPTQSRHLHNAGDEISIPKEGVLYKRTAGWTYWEATTDHIIFEAVDTKEKYYFGPSNRWEPESPNSVGIRIPPPTLYYRLYPNSAYGTETATLQIAKITPN